MATNITLQQDAQVTQQNVLLPLDSSGGRLSGFGNMFRKELGEWFGGRRWLVQSLIWIVLIDGFLAFVLFAAPAIEKATRPEGAGVPPGMGLTLFFSLAIQLGAIGIIILAQDEIIGEKQSGTAAWILSKPVSRFAFIFSKLAACLIGLLVFIVSLPAAIAYGELFLADKNPAAVAPFVIGLAVLVLTMLFYLTLTVLLGVLFDSRAPIISIALGVMFGGAIVEQFFPQIRFVLPSSIGKIATELAQGLSLSSDGLITLVVTAAWTLVFTGAAVWRFQRVEF